MLPIFDSLTHPTLTGAWFTEDIDASMETLSQVTRNNDIYGFCAVGLPDFSGYDHNLFFDMVSSHKKCFPVAGFNPYRVTDIAEQLMYIKALGYKAIKLHPRLGGYYLDANDLILNACFEWASQLELVIFLCTYTSAKLESYPNKDPYWELVKLLKRFSGVRCILLHGGVTQLMQYADLVRYNRNLLLDLSYTIIKYKHSSIDLDIQYLFLNLDQRLCIGTDHPEYTMVDLRHCLQDFEKYTPVEKLRNIYYKNLQTFLGFNV